MNPVIDFILTLWLLFAIVAGLYTVLLNDRLNPYVQVTMWIFSPILFINGFIFVKPERKKLYFQKLKTQLLTK